MLSPNLIWHHLTRSDERRISKRLTAGLVQRGKRAGTVQLDSGSGAAWQAGWSGAAWPAGWISPEATSGG